MMKIFFRWGLFPVVLGFENHDQIFDWRDYHATPPFKSIIVFPSASYCPLRRRVFQ